MTTFESVATALTTLAALVAVLLAAWFVLRWMGKKMPGQTGSRHIKVLDRVMISQNQCIVLVRVGGKLMLIGFADGAVQRLCDVEEAALTVDAPAEQAGFSGILQTFMQHKRAENASGNGENGEAKK